MKISIYEMMDKTETPINNFVKSEALMRKIQGDIESIEQIEDVFKHQLQRIVSKNLLQQDKLALEGIIEEFRNNEYVIARTVNPDDFIPRMYDVLKQHFTEENWLCLIADYQWNYPSSAVSCMVHNMCLLVGRRGMRAFLKYNGFSNAEVAYVMTRYSMSMRID